ncbi:MAG: ATP-binding protein [Bacteroidales bacterium]|nr:ATP-binding protein [Bacteroidales bacterium]
MDATFIRLNRHWSGDRYASLYKRDVLESLLAKKDLPHIQVLTGIRRSGKSTLFELLINDLMDSGIDPRSILRLNMDEPVFTFLWNDPSGLYPLIEKAEALTGVKTAYLFLDEIQQVKDWELFAKSAYDTQGFRKLYITGSNSDLLERQFATLLSGRYFANVVRPFSFRELLRMQGLTDKLSILTHKMEALRLTDRYLQWGGFPEIVLHELSDDVKTELLQNYYDSIVLKDCIAYNRVRDADLFYRLLHYLLTNAGTPFKYATIAKALNSNENSVRNYLAYAAGSYVLADVLNFSFSLKSNARPEHKAYCIDNGLMNAVRFQFLDQKGKLLENAVYNALIDKGYSDISFVRKARECDFVVRKDNAFHAFQVCYELTDINRDREIAGFNVPDIQNIATRTLITYNQQGETEGVRIVPFFLWCVEEE